MSSCPHIPLLLCPSAPCFPDPLSSSSCSCVSESCCLCPRVPLFPYPTCSHIPMSPTPLSSCPLALMFPSPFLPTPLSPCPHHPPVSHTSPCPRVPVFPPPTSHIPLCPCGPHPPVLVSLPLSTHPHNSMSRTSTPLSPTSRHPHVLHPLVPCNPASPRPIPATDEEGGPPGVEGRGGVVQGAGPWGGRSGAGEAGWDLHGRGGRGL